MLGKSCFFIGHRDAPETIAAQLEEAIERHITEYGVNAFVVGNYGGFDQMVQKALADAKNRHPDILIRMAVAYSPARVLVELPDGFENIYFPMEQRKTPGRAAIPHLNRILVNESNFLIACVNRTSGGAYSVLEYARRREKRGLIRVMTLQENG